VSSSSGGQGSDIVEIAVAYTYNPEYFWMFNNIKGNPNRGIVVRQITNGTDQLTLLGIATTAFDYAVGMEVMVNLPQLVFLRMFQRLQLLVEEMEIIHMAKIPGSSMELGRGLGLRLQVIIKMERLQHIYVLNLCKYGEIWHILNLLLMDLAVVD